MIHYLFQHTINLPIFVKKIKIWNIIDIIKIFVWACAGTITVNIKVIYYYYILSPIRFVLKIYDL